MALVAVLVVALLVYGNAVALVRTPQGVVVALHAGTGAVLLAAARARGLSWEAMGLDPAAIPEGLAWGAALAGLVGLATGALLRIPRLARALTDRRIAALTRRRLAFRLLVRIPVATAGFEEVAFRGVLLAAWAGAAGSTGWPVAGTSAAFGLWHVGSTVVLVRANYPGFRPAAVALAVAANVGVTALGGVLFAVLRLLTGGLAAPILAHTAINVAATLAARRSHGP